ncbi:MAG: sigma-54-dependent Fis family transcriptional regulator, partial [Halothiobacillus sp. 13-55-115]
DLLGVSALTDFPGDNSFDSSAEQNGLHLGSPPDVKSTWGATPPSSALEAEEQRQVLSALETTRWNRSEAARRLGLSLRQLRYRLAKWGVE